MDKLGELGSQAPGHWKAPQARRVKINDSLPSNDREPSRSALYLLVPLSGLVC